MSGYVYILASKKNWTLYVWVTSNLERRIYEHKNKLIHWFTSKYDITQLVYYCELPTIQEAIQYEKKIKGRKRDRKIELIQESNPNWENMDPSVV